MDDNKIMIDLTYYSDLLDMCFDREFIARALQRAARLDYSGERLDFDNDILDVAFSLLLPEDYKKTLATLKEQKASDDLFKKGGND